MIVSLACARNYFPEKITGVVLCGGSGARMDGADKPLVLIQGKPMVAAVLERLRGQVGRVLLNCNRSFEDYADLGPALVADQRTPCGPLSGIEAALQASSTPLTFVCPGDAPLLPTTLVAQLARSLGDSDDGAYPHDGVRSQHLFLLLRTSLLGELSGYLSGGGRTVAHWIDSRRFVRVDVGLDDGFLNLNTKADIRRFVNDQRQPS